MWITDNNTKCKHENSIGRNNKLCQVAKGNNGVRLNNMRNGEKK